MEILLEPTSNKLMDHLKMEMEIPCSSIIKFITACSYLNDTFEDIMKAQVSIFKASVTLNIQAFKIKKSVSISFRMTQVHKMAKDHMMMIRDYDWMMISKKLKDHIQVKLKPKNPKFPKKVYKVVKALYGSHQAPRACTPIETQKSLTKDEEAADVDVHLYRSMIGSLMYLIASRPDIMFAVCACSRVSSFDLEAYSDTDYARANLDRKSTTGGCEFLGRRLISWQCKKQTIVATSTTEAGHHFIRDAYEKKLIQMLKIHTDDNVADLLTKAFDVSRLRATYGAELVSAASLVNTARPTLSVAWLGKVGAARHKSWCYQANVCAACYRYYCCSQTVNNKKKIHATVDSKAVVVTEASIRSSLLLNDADAVICLATNQKFNFSKLIFDGMLRNLDTSKKKFLMYLRFLMVFLNNQIELGEPFNDVYVTPAHTQKVFSNISRKGVKFSGNVTLLFDSMLVLHQASKGKGLEQPTEPQPTPSPTQPSTGDQPSETSSSSSHDTTQDSRDSLEGTNRSAGDQVQPSHDSPLSGGPTSDRAEGGMTLEELSILCTNLSNKVLALEASKDAQAAEIIKLKT
ncbi:hypothetical protein Tco_1466898 [Tanacetum coccineum]